MARRRLNFELGMEPTLIDIGHEQDWKDKLYDLPAIPFKRNAPPLLPLVRQVEAPVVPAVQNQVFLNDGLIEEDTDDELEDGVHGGFGGLWLGTPANPPLPGLTVPGLTVPGLERGMQGMNLGPGPWGGTPTPVPMFTGQPFAQTPGLTPIPVVPNTPVPWPNTTWGQATPIATNTPTPWGGTPTTPVPRFTGQPNTPAPYQPPGQFWNDPTVQGLLGLGPQATPIATNTPMPWNQAPPIATNTTPLQRMPWGQTTPMQAQTPFAAPPVLVPNTPVVDEPPRNYWLPPLQNNPWTVRKSIYDQIKWKDNTGLNLRTVAQDTVKIQTFAQDKEFEFTLKNLKSRNYPDSQRLEVKNNLISKASYTNNLRQFKVTNSWTRYPEIAIRYFNYNYEQPKKEEVRECDEGDDQCVICGDTCTDENIGSCCKKARTCLECVGDMQNYKCGVCQGTFITPAMKAGHLMKIDANLRQRKIVVDNFGSIVNAAALLYKEDHPDRAIFLNMETPSADFYNMISQALASYEYKEELKNEHFNAYEYTQMIPNLEQIGDEAYNRAKKAYIDTIYPLITRKIIDAWGTINNVDPKGEKYQNATAQLEGKIRDSGIIENMFDVGAFSQLETLYSDENEANRFLDYYGYLMGDFEAVFDLEQE